MPSTLLTFTHFPAPAYAPKRDYAYLSEEPGITRVARALGFEPMPWQRFVWAVGTEYQLDPRGRKIYRFNDVLVSTPRQSGKTTLLMPLRIYRMITNPAAHLFSTAQSQKHASKRMLDMVGKIDRSILGPLFHPRRGKGDAGLVLKANAADLAQFTPNEEAAHGETSPYIDWDEIWAFTVEEGNSVLGGLRPSQITLHGRAQRWYTSTKGTLASTFMNGMVDESIAGKRPKMAYFSWEMPDGADPYDPATWWLFHPALGNTITETALKDETEMPEGEWLRAYCNRLTEHQSTFMPMEDWELMAEGFPNLEPRPLSQTTIGVEVAPSNENAAVVAAWHENGQPVLKVVHQAPGTAWLIGYLRGLHADHGVQAFAVDGKGPVRRIVDQIRDTLPIIELGFPERLLADQTLITACRDDGTLIHDGSQALKMAIANAFLRKSNGVELFDRDKSTQPIPSLIAASVALHVDSHPAPISLPPMIIS